MNTSKTRLKYWEYMPWADPRSIDQEDFWTKVAAFFFFRKDMKMQCPFMLLLRTINFPRIQILCVLLVLFFHLWKSITCWHQWIHTILLTRQMELRTFYPCRFFARLISTGQFPYKKGEISNGHDLFDYLSRCTGRGKKLLLTVTGIATIRSKEGEEMVF